MTATHRLLATRFSADLKQLQNRDFSTSNRSKTIRVLTRTQSSCSDDRLPIGYLLPDFQPISRNFFASLFHNQKEGVALRLLLFGLRRGASRPSRAGRPSWVSRPS